MKIKRITHMTGGTGVRMLIGVLILAVVILGGALFIGKGSHPPIDNGKGTGGLPAQPGPTANDLKQLQDSLMQAFAQGQQQTAKALGDSIQALVNTNNALQQKVKDNAASSEALSKENEYLQSLVTNLSANVETLSNKLATTPLAPPPTGDVGGGGGGGGGDGSPSSDNNNVGDIANMVATGICLIQPPYCAAAQLIAKVLGLVGSKESLRTFEKIVKGLGASPDEIKHLTDELSKAGVPLKDLIDVREGLEKFAAGASNPQVTTLLDKVKDIMKSRLAAGVDPFIKAIQANPPKSAAELKKLLDDQFPAGFQNKDVSSQVIQCLQSFGSATGVDVGWMIDQVNKP